MKIKTQQGWVVYTPDRKRVGKPVKTSKLAGEQEKKLVPKSAPEGGTYGGRG